MSQVLQQQCYLSNLISMYSEDHAATLYETTVGKSGRTQTSILLDQSETRLSYPIMGFGGPVRTLQFPSPLQ
eukprot:3415693-Amphidinium_carterae.2